MRVSGGFGGHGADTGIGDARSPRQRAASPSEPLFSRTRRPVEPEPKPSPALVRKLHVDKFRRDDVISAFAVRSGMGPSLTLMTFLLWAGTAGNQMVLSTPSQTFPN